MISWRQSLKDSINQIFSDTTKAHRMNIYYYEYNQKDVEDKLQYKQEKKFPWFVHNPYRVKIENNFYQAYSIEIEKDSSYKKVNYKYYYETNSEGIIIKENYMILFDNDLDGVIDEERQRYYADYIYDENNQISAKQYAITDTNPYMMTIDIDDFEFESIPKEYSPVIRYQWDDRGNLIKVSTHPDKDRPTQNHVEEYFYNEENQLIKMRRQHPRDMLRGFNKHIRGIYDLYFDERGSVIKIESINDDGKTVHATYLYEYSDYDKYGNWTTNKCYLDGVINGKPTIVNKRIIEYYDE